MNTLFIRFTSMLRCGRNKGMELVQVAILIAIAVALGLIFKDKIGTFVKDVFKNLNASKFSSI